MSSIRRWGQPTGVLRGRDTVLRIRGVDEAVELMPIHPGLAPAALEVEDKRGWGREDLRTARREKAGDGAQGVVLEGALVLSLGVERGERAIAGLAA